MEGVWGCFFPITEKHPHAFLKLGSIPTPKLVARTAHKFLTSLVTVDHSSLKQKECGDSELFSEERSYGQVPRINLSQNEFHNEKQTLEMEPVLCWSSLCCLLLAAGHSCLLTRNCVQVKSNAFR